MPLARVHRQPYLKYRHHHWRRRQRTSPHSLSRSRSGWCIFEASNLISQSGGNYQLTVTGAKVAQAYTALVSAAAVPAPAVTLVANAEGETPQIAPNTWVEIKGTNLAPAGESRI
jgi:hypothetical protein